MKVNMTPNPLDVVTIHASQGDTEARQWEFELHNNGELIDTSEVTEQMFFKAYKGGTEQLLPENTSTPTTSPFKGDIKYPQGLLADQEFTYRQSPTEEDGLAKITDIKGNTLVWNQLVQNGNFADVSAWGNFGCTYTVSNGIATIKSTTVGNQFGIYQQFKKKANHKYFISFEMHKYGTISVRRNRFSSGQENLTDGVYQRIETSQVDDTLGSAYQFCFGQGITNIDTDYFTLKNFMIVDLTQMGLDITDPSEFASLFSLPYYAYNQGSLLSFNGNGIKTVGANPMFGATLRNNINWIYQKTSNRAIIEFDVEPSTQYTIKIDYSSNVYQVTVIYKERTGQIQISNMAMGSGVKEFTVTTPSNCRLLCIQFESNVSVTFTDSDFPNRNSWYCLKDPSQISTLSLPISTYFPTGMKSAGSVYDELTESKAISRIESVDLGSLTWTYDSSVPRFYSFDIQNIVRKPESASIKGNILCPKYITETIARLYLTSFDHVIALSNTGSLNIKDTNYNSAEALKNSLQGVYLYYELATPTETPITTASLVTENAEIPLSNEDGTLIGKCTEQLSENPGFIDAKIKLSDSDGECYSNKIQLHVERSPQ